MNPHPPRPTKLAKCGCSFDTVRQDRETKEFFWVCWRHDETEEMADEAHLDGRKAHCTYCGKPAESKNHRGLAFFEHRANQDTDRYYCGCYGWD